MQPSPRPSLDAGGRLECADRLLIEASASTRPTGQVADRLARDFSPDASNDAWATDNTYISTYEGWMYLAAVIDLYSRQIVGWSMRPTMTSNLARQALLAAVWRRKPGPRLPVHSDWGGQYAINARPSSLKVHGMVASMSRSGNCHDKAIAESYFSLLKKARIKRYIYLDRAAPSSDVFDYVEVFCSPLRRHGLTADLSTVEFERC